MASVSLAPAAVEDCRCALRWAVRNAKQYNIDTDRIVLTGHSAGGHLSLITGMLPEGTGLDNNCDGTEKLRVAAIINWYGISDVTDLLGGPNRKNYAVLWMGSQPDPVTIAKRVSPLTYVRAGLPPILSIHGNADPVVPYDQSTRLHQALTAADVPNELVTIKGRRPRAIYGSRTRRCLPKDQRFSALSWPAAVALTVSLPALKLDFLVAIPSHDESELRLPDIFDLCPLGRHRMEE
jgi:acetyl esterase/lipase